MELTNGIRENFRDKRIERLKNSLRETPENLVNGQDVFLFQPTGSGKFESLGPERQQARIQDFEMGGELL